MHLIICNPGHKCPFHIFLSIQCSSNHCFHLLIGNYRVLLKFSSRRRFLQSRRRWVGKNLEVVIPQNAFGQGNCVSRESDRRSSPAAGSNMQTCNKLKRFGVKFLGNQLSEGTCFCRLKLCAEDVRINSLFFKLLEDETLRCNRGLSRSVS